MTLVLKKIEQNFNFPRMALNRQLNKYIDSVEIKKTEKGPATEYISTDKNSVINNYFNTSYTERPLALYDEKMLAEKPNLSQASLNQFSSMPEYQLNKREITKFLIDFSYASSFLEGETYSLIDIQVLIDYNEKAQDKPIEDAVLALNHKQAFEYLYKNMTLNSIFKVHNLITNDHQKEELANSRHFLTKEFRGKVRRYSDVDIALSSYIPPFRPEIDYLDKMLNYVLQTSRGVKNPIRSAFYLLTRIVYLQPFQDGNKRTLVRCVMCH